MLRKGDRVKSFSNVSGQLIHLKKVEENSIRNMSSLLMNINQSIFRIYTEWILRGEKSTIICQTCILRTGKCRSIILSEPIYISVSSKLNYILIFFGCISVLTCQHLLWRSLIRKPILGRCHNFLSSNVSRPPENCHWANKDIFGWVTWLATQQ